LLKTPLLPARTHAAVAAARDKKDAIKDTILCAAGAGRALLGVPECICRFVQLRVSRARRASWAAGGRAGDDHHRMLSMANRSNKKVQGAVKYSLSQALAAHTRTFCMSAYIWGAV